MDWFHHTFRTIQAASAFHSRCDPPSCTCVASKIPNRNSPEMEKNEWKNNEAIFLKPHICFT